MSLSRAKWRGAPRKALALPEWLLQSHFVAELHRLEALGWPLAVAGDMNAARRSPQEALKCKAMGMTAGEPDLRLYGSPGRVLLVELKRKGGRTSKCQDARIARLAELGFGVLVLTLESEEGARLMAYQTAVRFCDPAGMVL